MANPESIFSQYIKNRMPREVYAWKIMNGMQNGIPDLYFSGCKSDLWAESKWVKIPKKETTAIDPGLSALQTRWLYNRWKEGRNVCVLVGSPIGCVVLQNEAMFDSIYKHHLCTPKKEIAEWIIQQTHGSLE